MFGDLIILFLTMVGIIGLLISLALLFLNIFIKSKIVKIIALGTLGVAGLCLMILPLFSSLSSKLDEFQVTAYSGLYKADLSKLSKTDSLINLNQDYYLKLKNDGTFHMDKTPGIHFSGAGKWDVNGDGEDGNYGFKAMDETLFYGIGHPFSDSESKTIVFYLYDENEVTFIKKNPK